MIADIIRRPRLLSWNLSSVDGRAHAESTVDDLPAVSDTRDGLPRVTAVLAAVTIPVVALTAAAEVGAGFAYRDVVALLIAYAIATVVLVRVPWSTLPGAWSGSLIGLQLLFIVSLTSLTGAGESPYFALYAAVLAIAGWHLSSGAFVGVVGSVAIIEAWRALAVNASGSFDQVTIGLPFFGALGLLSLVTARRLTTVLVLLRQDQARTSATLEAVRDLAGDIDHYPLGALSQAAGRVFDSQATAVEISPTVAGSRGAVIARSGGRQLTVAISGAASTYGLLHLERPLPYSSTERRLIAILADVAGRALDARRMFNDLRQASERDALTGLLNRRSLDADLDGVIGPAMASGQTVTIAFVDIDGLKAINDAYGHEVGDQVIRRAGRGLAAAVRYEDRVYRSGGDEFVVLGVGLSPLESSRLGERLRDVPAHASRRSIDPHHVPITLSVGVAIASGSDVSPAQLLADADREMYLSRASVRAAKSSHKPAST